MNVFIVEDCVCSSSIDVVTIIEEIIKHTTPIVFSIPEYLYIPIKTHESNAPPKYFSY